MEQNEIHPVINGTCGQLGQEKRHRGDCRLTGIAILVCCDVQGCCWERSVAQVKIRTLASSTEV
jgi:hypothetical protein